MDNRYSSPQTQENFYNPPPVSMGEWLVTFLISMIPIVNLIMVFVWAFGASNPSKANFFKAYLLLVAIAFAIFIAFALLGGTAGNVR